MGPADLMVVDISVVLAILLQEGDAARSAAAVEAVETQRISAASVVEAGVVLLRREGPDARVDLTEFLTLGGLRIEPVTPEQVQLALDAYERYGKRTGHPAQLNFGDCFAYDPAKSLDVPLLLKGDDFARADIAGV